jgi:hypothetical protein
MENANEMNVIGEFIEVLEWKKIYTYHGL